MCGFDIVVFESAVHDLASPDRRAHRLMQAACSKPDAPCTDADLMPALHNESWRLDLFAAYRAHLEELMGMWKQCAEQRAKQQRTRRRRRDHRHGCQPLAALMLYHPARHHLMMTLVKAWLLV